MRDDEPMAASLSTQLEGLKAERERLEELLMLDANWRALRQLEEREAADQPLQAVDGAELKAGLARALAGNRIYVARARLLETIELLSAEFPGRSPVLEGGPLSSRIVMLSEPTGDTFRARLRLKPETGLSSLASRGTSYTPPTVPVELEAAAAPEPPLAQQAPDPLDLIDGLGPRAVALLLDGGVTRFADIARWSSVDVATWRARLDGATQGSAGWWIEQAAILATGRSTHFAQRSRRGEFAVLVPAPQPEPPRPWSPATTDAAGTSDVVSAGSAQVGPPALPESARAAPCVTAECVTAEELARALEQSHVPPPLPVAAAITEAAAAGRLGYVRPQAKVETAGSVDNATAQRGAVDGETGVCEADVAVVTAHEASSPAAVAPASAGGRPRTLLRRMKALQQTDRFEADAYAAYRGSVEEASVTILAAAEAKPETAAPAVPEGGVAARPASRFLKALTGKS